MHQLILLENFWDLYGTLKVTVTGHHENRKEDISMTFEFKIFPQVCSSDALKKKGFIFKVSLQQLTSVFFSFLFGHVNFVSS